MNKVGRNLACRGKRRVIQYKGRNYNESPHVGEAPRTLLAINRSNKVLRLLSGNAKNHYLWGITAKTAFKIIPNWYPTG
jgi:hypothetical protein